MCLQPYCQQASTCKFHRNTVDWTSNSRPCSTDKHDDRRHGKLPLATLALLSTHIHVVVFLSSKSDNDALHLEFVT